MEQIDRAEAVIAVSGDGYERFVPGRSFIARAIEEIAMSSYMRKVPVLLVGELGTGKRMLAARIHQRCMGDRGVLKILNCAQLTSRRPISALDSEDGHGFGEINGADTLLLENISDLAPASQAKILPLVATAAIRGESNGVRLIATSDRQLQQDVHAGVFREDLFYLLSGFTVTIPPLRYRREDILPLIDFFLRGCARELQRPTPVLSAPMQRFLLEYPWPGNVAELREAARVIVAVGDVGLAMAALRSRAQEVQRIGPRTMISLKQAVRAASRQTERTLILNVLARTRWNRKRAAQELQISYKALLYKLKQVGLDAKFSEKEQR
ncbi:sigma-54-dependent Fis family transcriptional regulator [Acidobacteria bacterium AB60]|nr:sigma-54-dependent Fis family transcriptional regulator [Acidobacteria bacterium AB60]